MTEKERQESAQKYLIYNATFHKNRIINSIPKDLKPKFNITEIIKMYEHLGFKSFTITIDDLDLCFYEKYIVELKANGVKYDCNIYLGGNSQSYISCWFNNIWIINESDLDNFKRRNGFLYAVEIANITSITFKVYL